MGLLVDGVWQDHDRDIAGAGGTFARTKSAFRNWVTPDGAPGPSGAGGFAAARGRYHLYVALSCPLALRSLIFRALKKLEGVV
jgi:putative glutathione S-transferase